MTTEKKIKNLKLAAETILKSISDGKPIIVYGDADLDGVASVIIAEESIKNLGGKVAAVYFPNRETEGYGITETALEKLNKYAPALLIALDLGIGNFKEVKLARKMGFTTIIVDHHEILDGLPEADVVVDPKQKGDDYPFKFLSAAGIAFKLAEELFGEKFNSSLRESFLELAALATLADMMPREADNRYLINEGLQLVKNSFRPGIKAFFESTDPDLNTSDFNKKISKIISVLNVRDVKKGFPAAYQLLTSTSKEISCKLIDEFIQINMQRREKIKIIVEEIDARISNDFGPLIFEGDEDWDPSLMGTVSSIICHKYDKPTFLHKKMGSEALGTVRSTDEVNSVELMKKCRDLLITFGGHPKASGFRIKKENLEKFKACLIENL